MTVSQITTVTVLLSATAKYRTAAVPYGISVMIPAGQAPIGSDRPLRESSSGNRASPGTVTQTR
eukprot:751592-Hanusia_phi.AAC.1